MESLGLDNRVREALRLLLFTGWERRGLAAVGQGREPGPSVVPCSKSGRAPACILGPSARILKQKETSETGSVANIQVTDGDTGSEWRVSAEGLWWS